MYAFQNFRQSINPQNEVDLNLPNKTLFREEWIVRLRARQEEDKDKEEYDELPDLITEEEYNKINENKQIDGNNNTIYIPSKLSWYNGYSALVDSSSFFHCAKCFFRIENEFSLTLCDIK